MVGLHWYLATALLATGCGGSAGARGAGELDGRWTARAPVGGGPVQEIAVVAVDRRVYLLGGFDDAGNVLRDVRVYDAAADLWSTAAPLPAAVHHVNAASVAGKIYVVGALRGAFQATGVVWEYDPGMDRWTERAPMPAGSERGAAAVAVLDGRIYLAGGFRGAAVAEVSVYDPGADGWRTDLPPLPQPLDHLVGGVLGGAFHVTGGRDAALNARLFALDPAAGSWQERTAMPTARAGCAAAVLGGRLVVVGGEDHRPASAKVFAETESYDPLTDRWVRHGDMPVPRHGMGAAVVGQELHVPGGATLPGFQAVATHEVFELPAS